MINALINALMWPIAMLMFSVLLPLLRRRKLYFVTAGALFFTPGVAVYSWTHSLVSFWPLVACIPQYLDALFIKRFMDFEDLFQGVILPASVVGLIFWGLSYWLVPKVYYPGMRLFSIWPVLGIQLVVWPAMFILFLLYNMTLEVNMFIDFFALYVLFPALIVALIYKGLIRWAFNGRCPLS